MFLLFRLIRPGEAPDPGRNGFPAWSAAGPALWPEGFSDSSYRRRSDVRSDLGGEGLELSGFESVKSG